MSRPARYKDLDDAQYNRCILREQIVLLSKTDFGQLIIYLRTQEDSIRRAGFDDIAKGEIRCALYDASFNPRCTRDDEEMFDRLFGYYKPPRGRYNPDREDRYIRYHERTRTPEEEVEYRINCTYEVFYDWIVGKRFRSILHELSDHGRQRLRDGIEEAIQHNYSIGHTREYEEGDRERLYASLEVYGL